MKVTMTKLFIPIYLMLSIYSNAEAQNLIANPSNDQAMMGGEINSWVEVIGTDWTQRSNDPDSQDGDYYFFGGTKDTVELSQDIDVSSMASSIDNGTAEYEFSGYVRSYDQVMGDPDDGRIVVEYIDLLGTVLESYDSGKQAFVDDWEEMTDTRFAPSGTRIIKVRLIGYKNSGANNDAYFDNLTLYSSAVAPVELLSFTGSKEKGVHVLDWVTLTEVNNEGFYLQHSSDANIWKALGFIDGVGTTSVRQEYNFTNTNPFKGNNYYRLRQVDFDKSVSYSDIVSLDFGKQGEFSIYPVPANQGEPILITGDLTFTSIQITNLLGKVISYNGGLNTKEYSIPTIQMAVGQYDVLINNEFHQTIIIQ